MSDLTEEKFGPHSDRHIRKKFEGRITPHLAEALDSAFSTSDPKGEVSWDFTYGPGPQGGIVTMVFAMVPSPVLGEVIQGHFIQGDVVNFIGLAEQVRGLTESLLKARSEALEAQPRQPLSDILAGPRSSGIVIPGDFGRG